MISAQRRALILEQLRRMGAGSITGLSESIGVSASTIRRDLEFLTRTGHIERSHGGAILLEQRHTTFEPAREIIQHVAHGAKVKIGTRAASLLAHGQSVIFDSSSTVLEAARVASAKNLALTACTNDLAIATLLARAKNIHLVVLGGTIRPGSLTMTGDPGLSFLDRLHADIALIGIHSLAGARLSETSIDVAAIKRRMLASATHSVLLADSTKFQHPAFCDVCSAADLRSIITDAGIAAADRDRLTQAGVEVIVAD
jgi:DeoR family transcriptional regulator, aga operon transcriptional repressor